MAAIKNAFKAMYASINPSFYREIAYQPFKKSLGYLMILVLAVAIILSTKSFLSIRENMISFSSQSADYFSDIIANGLTEVKIENGELSSPVAQPHIYKKDDFAIVLNTAGNIGSLSDDYRNAVLLSKHKIVFKVTKENGVVEFKEMDLKEHGNYSFLLKARKAEQGSIYDMTYNGKTFSVSKDNMVSLAKKIALWLLPLMLIFKFAFGVMLKLLQVLIFSLIGLVANGVSGAKLKYSNLMNIGVYAITPPTLLSVIWIVFLGGNKAFLHTWPMFYIAFYIILIFLAVRSLRQPEVAGGA